VEIVLREGSVGEWRLETSEARILLTRVEDAATKAEEDRK